MPDYRNRVASVAEKVGVLFLGATPLLGRYSHRVVARRAALWMGYSLRMSPGTTRPLFLALLIVAGCDCESSRDSEDVERATYWAKLSFCLTGTETLTPDLMARITLAAMLEDVEGLPEAPTLPEEGSMGASADEPHPDARRWPRRCGQYARALEDALRGAPAEHPAHRVTDALGRGEVDSAIYTLADRARAWPAATAVGVTPPPAPAAPLARADARYVVAGPRCRTTSVFPDASVSPSRHVAHVSCRDGRRHECILSGVALDTISCAPAREPRAAQPEEVIVGDWSFSRRRARERCTYIAHAGEREELLGEAECGAYESWVRPCRVEGFVGVVVSHEHPSSAPKHLAILDDDAFRWFDAPALPSGRPVISCDAEAMRFTGTSTRWEFVPEEMRSGMIRPPTRTFIVVSTHRCTAAGCEASSAELAAEGRWETAAPVGEEVVVVEDYQGDDGDGLIARIAPLDELANAPAVWVLDGADGAELDETSLFQKWAAAPDATVLFLTDVSRGVMALRFEAGGGFSYLAPSR